MLPPSVEQKSFQFFSRLISLLWTLVTFQFKNTNFEVRPGRRFSASVLEKGSGKDKKILLSHFQFLESHNSVCTGSWCYGNEKFPFHMKIIICWQGEERSITNLKKSKEITGKITQTNQCRITESKFSVTIPGKRNFYE